MRTRITLLVASVALVTLSFTFAGGKSDTGKVEEQNVKSSVSSPVGGMLADEVVK